jgi:CHAT domain-containing protein/Tfp pilus assembly protein PilF
MRTLRILFLLTFGFWAFATTPSDGGGWQGGIAAVENLAAAGNMDSAAVVLDETLSNAVTEYDKSDSTVAIVLSRDGMKRTCYFRSYEDAESLYTQALRLKERISGKEDAGLALIVRDLGFVLFGARKYEECEKVLERAISLQERVLGPEDVDLAMTLGLSAAYHHMILGQFDSAESLYTRAISIQEKAFGPDHEALTAFLYTFALMLMDQGKFAEALALQERDVAIKTRMYGPNSGNLTSTLNHMGFACVFLGKYAEAESLYTRSLAINEAEYGPDGYRVAYSLEGLAGVYETLGRFTEAEVALRRALPIMEREEGPESRSVADIANTLGNVYSDLGRYAEAVRYYQRSVEINEKKGPRERANMGVGLYNLANIRRDQGMYSEAEILFKRAIKTWEEIFGPDHMQVAGGCIELGMVYRLEGRYADAESLLYRAIPIADKVFGPGNVDAARAYRELGEIYLAQGRYSEADSLLREALAIFEPDPGATVENTPNTLESLARLERSRGAPNEALAMAGRAMDIRRRVFLDNVHTLSERDALSYSRSLRKSVDLYLSWYFELSSPDESVIQRLADAVFASKGQVSDGIFEQRRSLISETDAATLELAEDLRIAKFRLSKLFVEGPDEDRDAYRTKVDSLAGVANDLEADLWRRSASFRENRERQEVDGPRIADALPQGAVLIEYVRYDSQEIAPERLVPRYMAIVLKPDGAVVVVDLGEADSIDILVGKWRDHMLRVASSGRSPTIIEQEEYDRLSGDLYDKVWKPLEPHATGKGIVFLAPDGALNLVAFAGLKTPDGEYLVEKHTLHYLSAGRDLVRLEHRGSPSVGLLALGDPNYGAKASDRLAALSEPPDSVLQVAFRTRNLRSSCGALNEIKVSPLPGTRREVELISKRWEETTFEPVVDCYGDDASEERFKAEAPGKRVIHLATHGYFLGGACLGEEAGDIYVGENPLLLSGLLFAGANLHGEGADSVGAEDGILTAYEVSALDLEGTELVVLSACETGLGEITQGEGVYGLRRAFQMAGARTVVSALWPVSEATVEMMGRLYARRDENLPEAMRRVQLERIKELRAGGGIDHPFTWGAFIAVGDWR